MCKAMEDRIREERKEDRRTTALTMLSDGVLSLEKIAEYVRLPLDEVKKLQAEQGA